MKVRTMLMVAAMAFAIIPMAIYAFVSINMINSRGEEAFSSEMKAVAENQIASLDAVGQHVSADLDTIQNAPGVEKAVLSGEANDDAKAFLKYVVEQNPNINHIRILSRDAKIIVSSDESEIGSLILSLREGYSNEEIRENALYFETIAEVSVTSAFAKRNIDRDCILVINYDVSGNTSILAKAVGNTKFNNDNGSAMVVDAAGNFSETGAGFNKEPNLNKTIKGKISGTTDGRTSEVFTYDGPTEQYTAVVGKASDGSGLAVVVRCATSAVSTAYRDAGTPIIAAVIVMAIIAIVAAVIVSGSITAPLKKIEETLEYIKNGDHEARIGNMSANEYGQLSRAFNNLVDEIVVSEDRYKNISEMSDNIIFEWNFRTNEVVFSNNFNKKFSYRAPSDHFGDSFLLKAKLHPDDADKYRKDLDQLEKGNSFSGNEYRIKNIYGDFIWVLMRTETLRDKEGKAVKVVGVMVDIDRAKKSEAQLTEKASYDALTDLYNRETIESTINNEISLSEARKSELAVLFVDVDDFKHYNDNYSHATGDEVLKFLAKTIKDTVGDAGFAGRYGGDEFIVMVRNAEVNSPAQIAQKIISRLSDGFDSSESGDHLSVSVSIGIALIKDDYNTRVEYLIGKADDAMYSVKKSGKSNYAFI